MIQLLTFDSRTPLVLDIHELERRPGTMQLLSGQVPAPADLGIGGVVGVPSRSDLELDLRLESVMEGVLVSGSARAGYVGECVRCLDPVDGDVDVDIQQLYAYPEADLDDEADEDELRVVDDTIDLEQPVRDAVVLALPQAPVCRDDCPGLCAQCGARLADDPAHKHDNTDPRWAALAGLLAEDAQKKSNASGAATEPPGAVTPEEN